MKNDSWNTYQPRAYYSDTYTGMFTGRCIYSETTYWVPPACPVQLDCFPVSALYRQTCALGSGCFCTVSFCEAQPHCWMYFGTTPSLCYETLPCVDTWPSMCPFYCQGIRIISEREPFSHGKDQRRSSIQKEGATGEIHHPLSPWTWSDQRKFLFSSLVGMNTVLWIQCSFWWGVRDREEVPMTTSALGDSPPSSQGNRPGFGGWPFLQGTSWVSWRDNIPHSESDKGSRWWVQREMAFKQDTEKGGSWNYHFRNKVMFTSRITPLLVTHPTCDISQSLHL